MLDDLRKSSGDSQIDDFDFNDEFGLDAAPKKKPKRFLGMTPIERMFLMIFFFMNVLVIGLALLLATGRIVF
ncbi:hypothetical protein FBR02_15195 [Anaerolineae bacterium CFX9]|jgi:hypothetical protein|nr:hypothetical protein [Anaerolineae bacterium CFX9]